MAMWYNSCPPLPVDEEKNKCQFPTHSKSWDAESFRQFSKSQTMPFPIVFRSILTVPEVSADFLREKGADDVLVVTDRGLMQLGLPNGMLQAMDEAGIRYTCFSDLGANPTTDDVEKGFRLFRENNCKAIVAFGGGSPMDCAKAIGAKAAHPKKIHCADAGYSAGAEAYPSFVCRTHHLRHRLRDHTGCGHTDSATHRKASINDPFLIPKYAVLDPELTVGLPPHITAATGMDALCHAVESYTNHTYNTPVENDMAKKAVRLIYDNILRVYENGRDLEARQNMQMAALYAGRAFTRGCVGYVHAIGHTLGGLYGVAHGLAMAVLLPHVMREFGASAHRRLAELADVCGIDGANEAEKANAFIRWIEETNAKMGIPDKFDMIQDKDIDQMITWAKKEANPLYPVPVVWARKDFRRLIESVRK